MSRTIKRTIGALEWSWRHNGLNLPIEEVSPGLQPVRRTYDGRGRLLQLTDNHGLSTTFDYDGLSTTTQTNPDGTLMRTTSNAQGLPIEWCTPGIPLNEEDANGMPSVIGEACPEQAQVITRADYEHSPAVKGVRVTKQSPTGHKVIEVIDALGRSVSAQDFTRGGSRSYLYRQGVNGSRRRVSV